MLVGVGVEVFVGVDVGVGVDVNVVDGVGVKVLPDSAEAVWECGVGGLT